MKIPINGNFLLSRLADDSMVHCNDVADVHMCIYTINNYGEKNSQNNI